MTLNDFIMFAIGVFWGIFIIQPIYHIFNVILKNAKENVK
jgi:hypothetical protein